jgi:Na+/proline symporter
VSDAPEAKLSIVERVLLGFAVLLMIVGAASNLFGDWLMMSAFNELATAESVDPDTFLDSFRLAESLMLVGNLLLLLATGDIATAVMMTKTEASMTRTAVAIGVISFVFLLLMVFWGQSSMLPFSDILTGERVEPSSLAASMNGVLRADFLSQGSVIGFAVATLIVAVSRRKELTKD